MGYARTMPDGDGTLVKRPCRILLSLCPILRKWAFRSIEVRLQGEFLLVGIGANWLELVGKAGIERIAKWAGIRDRRACAIESRSGVPTECPEGQHEAGIVIHFWPAGNEDYSERSSSSWAKRRVSSSLFFDNFTGNAGGAFDPTARCRKEIRDSSLRSE
jgi:hypothetical protein